MDKDKDVLYSSRCVRHTVHAGDDNEIKLEGTGSQGQGKAGLFAGAGVMQKVFGSQCPSREAWRVLREVRP